MSRVPFRIGGPTETWCRQVKKRGTGKKGEMEYQKKEKWKNT